MAAPVTSASRLWRLRVAALELQRSFVDDVREPIFAELDFSYLVDRMGLCGDLRDPTKSRFLSGLRVFVFGVFGSLAKYPQN
ncbi:unnamed protein product [Linum trigynum]|uniref:Uncharacterized protein n=1 Tax=Linum trigynum TaxID=586398 RepID=A0AAV2G3B8_9ROSI